MTVRFAFVPVILIWVFLICPGASAHGHHPGGPLVQAQPANEPQALVFRQIGQAYNERIQPIFEKKCFDCHSDHARYPWYYKIPGIKQLIDSDIHEAHQHLDFSKGYPFISHANPADDLDAIHDELEDNDMPPWDYRLMHPGTSITDQEKKTIFSWVDQSEDALLKVGIQQEDDHK